MRKILTIGFIFSVSSIGMNHKLSYDKAAEIFKKSYLDFHQNPECKIGNLCAFNIRLFLEYLRNQESPILSGLRSEDILASLNAKVHVALECCIPFLDPHDMKKRFKHAVWQRDFFETLFKKDLTWDYHVYLVIDSKDSVQKEVYDLYRKEPSIWLNRQIIDLKNVNHMERHLVIAELTPQKFSAWAPGLGSLNFSKLDFFAERWHRFKEPGQPLDKCSSNIISREEKESHSRCACCIVLLGMFFNYERKWD